MPTECRGNVDTRTAAVAPIWSRGQATMTRLVRAALIPADHAGPTTTTLILNTCEGLIMDRITTAIPRSVQAVNWLWARAEQEEAEPELVDAAHVLEALLAAAARAGGGDELILHWLTNSADLARPRQVLGGLRRVSPAKNRVRGRRFADDLVAFDRARQEYREAVREISADAVRRATATP